MLRDTYARNADSANFRLFCPDETNSNRLGAVFEVDNRCFVGKTLPIDDHVAPDGRVMEVLSEHLCGGYHLLTGRHGLFASYEAFAMISASMIVQHTKWLEEAINLSWREPIYTQPLNSPSWLTPVCRVLLTSRLPTRVAARLPARILPSTCRPYVPAAPQFPLCLSEFKQAN